ncbi:MAG: hypothetical protein QOJ39_603 [Candidatus Eremiobacteraeota bacterium]|jgi:hypothetical protein|nr:hypothetical protein [Candidatus Eremiobacteraeota bacterium]
MRALPGVAPLNLSHGSKPQTGRLEPAVADPIPATVLQNPIMGESRRFDGSVAPPGWMLAQGQSLDPTLNQRLYSILGVSGGGDGRKVFKLPAPGFGVIVAVAGLYPTGPEMLALSVRRTSAVASLGPGARPAPPKMLKPPSEKVLAARRLLSAGPRVGRMAPVPVSRETSERIRQVTADARTGAFAALTAENRARLDDAVRSAVSGRASIAWAINVMSTVLSAGEVDALVRTNDGLIRSFNDRWQGEPGQDSRLAAASFLLSVAITRDDARAMYARERSIGR